jgi:hypothetical protein
VRNKYFQFDVCFSALSARSRNCYENMCIRAMIKAIVTMIKNIEIIKSALLSSGVGDIGLILFLNLLW